MTHEEARTFVKGHIKRKGKNKVQTTETLIRRWWGVLNIAIFYGRLNKPVKVEIKGIRNGFAWAEEAKQYKGRVNIRMQRRFHSKRMFLTILLHEMVHAWELQHHSMMGHGKRFFAWKRRIERTVGLELKESHNEHDYR